MVHLYKNQVLELSCPSKSINLLTSHYISEMTHLSLAILEVLLQKEKVALIPDVRATAHAVDVLPSGKRPFSGSST